MATLPFTAPADGSITVVLPSITAQGWIRIFHATDTDLSPTTCIRIVGFQTNIPVLAGDLVVQRLEEPFLRVRMAITAQTP